MLLSIAKAGPRNIESTGVAQLLPDNVQSNAQNLISFIEKYYEYLNTAHLPSYEISSIVSDKDIDSQSNEYLDSIKALIAVSIPNSSILNKVDLYKTIVKYYNTRGSEESIISFFKLFLNEIVTVSYPKETLFDLSSGSGRWLYPPDSWLNPLPLTAPPINSGVNYFSVSYFDQENLLVDNLDDLLVDTNDELLTSALPLTYNGVDEAIIPHLMQAGLYNGKKLYTDTGDNYIYNTSLRWNSNNNYWEIYNSIFSALWISNVDNDPLHDSPIHVTHWYPQGTATGFPYLTYYDGKSIATQPGTGEYSSILAIDINTNILYEYLETDESITWTVSKKSLLPRWAYSDNKGFVSDTNKLQDSYYYQLYSYVIHSESDSSKWKDDFLKFVHPAGLKLFSALLLKLNALNRWENELLYTEDVLSDSVWLKYLIPPSIYAGDHTKSHSPKFQPGWLRDRKIQLLLTYLLDDQSTEYNDRSDYEKFYIGFVIHALQLLVINDLKNRNYYVKKEFDAWAKFIDETQLNEGLLNLTINDIIEDYSPNNNAKLLNISSFREKTLFEWRYSNSNDDTIVMPVNFSTCGTETTTISSSGDYSSSTTTFMNLPNGINEALNQVGYVPL